MNEEKTVISINSPAPAWTTWVFRSFYLLNIALTFWISGTKLIPEGSKVEIILATRVLDGFAWGIGRALGVKKADIEDADTV